VKEALFLVAKVACEYEISGALTLGLRRIERATAGLSKSITKKNNFDLTASNDRIIPNMNVNLISHTNNMQHAHC